MHIISGPLPFLLSEQRRCYHLTCYSFTSFFLSFFCDFLITKRHSYFNCHFLLLGSLFMLLLKHFDFLETQPASYMFFVTYFSLLFFSFCSHQLGLVAVWFHCLSALMTVLADRKALSHASVVFAYPAVIFLVLLAIFFFFLV